MATLIEVKTSRKHSLGAMTVIGRSESCNIRIDDPMVSANHATITQCADGAFSIRDNDSRRGTYVGARKVTEAPLADGDELLIGPTRLRFEAGAADTSSADREELVRLRAVVALGRAIGVEHDLEKLLERVLQTCFQLLRADRAAAVIYEPHSKAPFMTVALDRAGGAFAVSSSLLGQVMVTHQPYLRTEIDDDVALSRSESLVASGVRSVMAVPLAYQAGDTEWLGVILVDCSTLSNTFHARDLELLEAIAGPTALAIKNAMLVRHVQSVIGDEWGRLDRVVRDLPLGVVVLDDRRRCVLVNRWAARHKELGRPSSGSLVETIAGIPTSQLIGADMRTTTTTESDRILSIAANTMTEGRETVIVISDITEERERQNQAAHRDRVALVGQLAGGVAHDFNNLLHVILTYANMLEETLTDPDQRDDAHQITHAATSAAELTRQLLTFSRRELVKPKVIDVPHILHGMEKMLLRTVGPQIDLAIHVAPRIPRVLMDTSQLEQILMNLVVNARDAMLGRGSVRVAVTNVDVDPELAHERNIPVGSYVGIEVSDSGSGMSPDVVARIFEPYFTTKARNKGTGLGLATVHGIVQQANGDIHVDSTLGHGTSFHILLPATEQPAEQQRPIVDGLVGGATILVVDDDDNVRRVTERILRGAGYAVLSANSGHNAISFAREHAGAIDLVLTDIVMPGISGRDLAREILAMNAAQRVLFMSGYHQHAPIGSSQFISKPFQRVDLLEKVRTMLASEPLILAGA